MMIKLFYSFDQIQTNKILIINNLLLKMKKCKLNYKKFNLNLMEFYIKVNPNYQLSAFFNYVTSRFIMVMQSKQIAIIFIIQIAQGFDRDVNYGQNYVLNQMQVWKQIKNKHHKNYSRSIQQNKVTQLLIFFKLIQILHTGFIYQSNTSTSGREQKLQISKIISYYIYIYLILYFIIQRIRLQQMRFSQDINKKSIIEIRIAVRVYFSSKFEIFTKQIINFSFIYILI
ncbi:unnamed protein product [Paramecium pentaurelia]|uniref:Transmembrane protein n=1 Tax=Paramecium pentaurelia TaxID=43138 RepID=A0A8S1WP21_9CILI|nr:unnamed protein product [Paramecium pentaurelia]